MKGDPAAYPDADRRDLVLVTAGPGDPDTDPIVAPLAGDAEPRQRPDHPFLEPPDMATHVPTAPRHRPVEIEHQIGDALARAVIGVLATAAALEDRQPVGIEQVLGAGAGAGGVE